MDLFDKLPDDIIIHILSFLPTKFAVLTSVLSRRWKFLWCFGINSLVFDDRVSFRDFYHIAQHRYYVPDRVLYFHNFIDKVLKLSKASQVESFYLMMYSCLRIPNSVSSWIDEIVNKRKAKKIEIYFGDDVCSSGFKVFLPLQTFNSTTLQVLKLHFCNSNPLAGSKINNAKRLFLPNLKVLHFWMESFQVRCWLLFYLLRASPKLEVAYFGGHSGNSKAFFNIYAPSLKRLRMKFRSIDSSSKFLINAPILEELVVVDESFQKHIIKSNCLVRAKLDIGLPYLRKVQRLHVYINRFCKLLSKIYHVKFLNLKAHTMDALSISCNHRHDSLPQFLSLRRLQLRFLNYSSWDVLPKLLECSPNLEVLVLSKDFKGKDAEFRRDSTWIQPSSVPACLLSCLRWVEVWDCESHQVEFDLISYLLKHGEVLSTFLVELLPANSREDLRFREKLMVISSVSRTCKLKISAYPHCSQHNGFSPDVEDFLFQELQWRMPPQKLSFEDLRLCTNYFSDENLIVRTKYFKIYRGKHYQSGAYDSLAKDVVVKRWIIPAKSPFNKYKEDSMRGFREELKLLKHPNFYCHPYFMNLLGYCVEDGNERLGVVYDFKALDCLENLIPKDSFKWLQRIKVALVLACILEYMHKKHGDLPSVTPRIKPAYVILDEDYMPVLCNFERKEIPNIYREDENYDYGIGIGYRYSRKDLDVENYGLTLLGLISKRVHRCPIGKRHTSECVTFRPIGKRHTSECVTFRRWATMQQADMDITSSLCKSQVPLVHKELMDDPTYDFVDGLKITRLAMRCLERPQHKPSMHAIVKYLCKLRVIKENWDVIDCDNVISTYLHIQVP